MRSKENTPENLQFVRTQSNLFEGKAFFHGVVLNQEIHPPGTRPGPSDLVVIEKNSLGSKFANYTLNVGQPWTDNPSQTPDSIRHHEMDDGLVESK